MGQNSQRWRETEILGGAHIEQVLERYYVRLVQWGTLLVRGDEVKARDLVHDLCLNLSIAKPDLSDIVNLDGYLYTSLRHIYLSGLARSSREALQFVHIAEFDSIQLALVPQGLSDVLCLQNDLRKICCYSSWRKVQTKGASYFILRFFHGYHHHEIATLACAPISAIYNKLRIFRAEVRSYLDEPGKLHFATRDTAPPPPQSWSLVSSLELFKELRKTILDARTGQCLREADLLAVYAPGVGKPLSCSLLSHIVSCHRCLSLIDSHLGRPTLEDREPLDSMSDLDCGPRCGANKLSEVKCERLLRSVRKHAYEIMEHRPSALSIAVDGRIVASHDALAERNVLRARIERPEHARFVEVFSELGIRLVLIPIHEMPPSGPHCRSQKALLSDERQLELNLSFDGLGLHIEVMYFDPALAPEPLREEENEDLLSRALPTGGTSPNEECAPASNDGRSTPGLLLHILQVLRPSPVLVWSTMLALLACVIGFIVISHNPPAQPLNARYVLNSSIQAEAARLKGQTEHEVFRLDTTAADGSVLSQGIVDVWKDGNGARSLRRLYNAHHHLIAAEWVRKNGEHGQFIRAEAERLSSPDHPLLAGRFWTCDPSPRAFQEWSAGKVRIRREAGGYVLIAASVSRGYPYIAAATLIPDSQLRATSAWIRLRSSSVQAVHLVEADYEYRPSKSIPDSTFVFRKPRIRTQADLHSSLSSTVGEVQLVELQIAALYELNKLQADTSEPIEVARTPDGRVRITGMVASEDRKQQLLSHLQSLRNGRRLQVHILAPEDLKHDAKPAASSGDQFTHYDIAQAQAPADTVVRAYFAAQGLPKNQMDAAIAAFSREALSHSQIALQNASALYRLSAAFSPTDLQSINFAAQQQWTEMLVKHASALQLELHALRGQLTQLSSLPKRAGDAQPFTIQSSTDVAAASEELLVKTREISQRIGSMFASSPTQNPYATATTAQITDICAQIPSMEAVQLTSFATRLEASGNSELLARRSGQHTPHSSLH